MKAAEAAEDRHRAPAAMRGLRAAAAPDRVPQGGVGEAKAGAVCGQKLPMDRPQDTLGDGTKPDFADRAFEQALGVRRHLLLDLAASCFDLVPAGRGQLGSSIHPGPRGVAPNQSRPRR